MSGQNTPDLEDTPLGASIGMELNSDSYSTPPSTPSSTASSSGDKTRSMAVGIGIELGTTHSSIAMSENKKAKIFRDIYGDTAIPSVVAFSMCSDDLYVGRSADEYGNTHPRNCIREVKQIIGLAYTDPIVQEEMMTCPFKVVEEDNKAKFQVVQNAVLKTFSPEEINAKILTRLASIAESSLRNMVVKDVVIAVPSRFGFHQRKATKDAARLAGLNLLEMIPEPVTAILVHGLNLPGNKERNVLVFDMTENRHDIAIYKIDSEGNIYERKAVSETNQVGGKDFTKNLMRHVQLKILKMDIFQRRSAESESYHQREMNYLRDECEKAKRDFSTLAVRTFKFAGITTRVSRAQFENASCSLLAVIRHRIQQALWVASMRKQDITEVIITGGASRMPMIGKMVKYELNKSKIFLSDEPEEDVAKGAALYAEMVKPEEKCMFGIPVMNLGISSPAQIMMVMIHRGDPIPCTRTRTFEMECGVDGKPTVSVYEGDSSLTTHNRLLGSFKCGRSKKKRKNVVEVVVTFSIRRDRLEVQATIPGTGDNTVISLQQRSANMTEEEIEQMHISRTRHLEVIRHIVDRERKLSDLEKGEKLGSGAFGTVYSWKDKNTGEEFAGKEVEMANEEKTSVLLQEAMKIKKLSHRNIVTCLGVNADWPKIYLFMELMKTSIANLVKDEPLEETRARAYTSDILDGLIYLHELGIVHKDIKGDNVLLDGRDVAKIADFGISRYYSGGTANTTRGNIIGTPFYLSPEVVNKGRHGERSDVWAVGCTVFEMVTGKPPFAHLEGVAVTYKIGTNEHRNLVEKLDVEVQLKDFLRTIFVYVEERPYAKPLKGHDWLDPVGLSNSV